MSLLLNRVVSRQFGPGAAFQPELSEFLADVALLYDVPTRIHEAPVRAGDARAGIAGQARRNCFTEMVREMLPEIQGNGAPVDLALVAHATPDAEPGWPGSELSAGLPGNPPACGIADQGTVAPFTALRIVDAHQPTVDRSVVVMLDQHTVVGEPVAAGQDALVALVLDGEGGLGAPAVSQWTNILPAEIDATLRSCWPASPETAIIGPGLARHWAPPHGVDTIFATGGLPCAGTWHALAIHLASFRRDGRRVVLADYESETGELSECWLDIPAGAS